MNSKKRMSVKRHAIRRARERYDVWLEIEDINAFNQIIRAGLGRTIEDRSKRRGLKVFVTSLCGVEMAAVYDPKKTCVATFLPLHAAEVRRALAKRQRLNGQQTP